MNSIENKETFMKPYIAILYFCVFFLLFSILEIGKEQKTTTEIIKTLEARITTLEKGNQS
jgi:hypothetical protein